MVGERRQARGARLRRGVYWQQLVVALQKCSNPVLVLGLEHPAGDVRRSGRHA